MGNRTRLFYMIFANYVRGTNFDPETLFTALQLFDLLLTKRIRDLTPEKIDGYAAVCLVISSKLFELTPFIYDNIILKYPLTNDQLFELEKDVIHLLEGNLLIPTIYSYYVNTYYINQYRYFSNMEDEKKIRNTIFNLYLRDDVYSRDFQSYIRPDQEDIESRIIQIV